jgi:thiopurine S-methyltransferase
MTQKNKPVKIKTEEKWEERYRLGDTGWDMGIVSPPLKAYFDQLDGINHEILFPGAGNAYEAEYLFKRGFNNIYIADIAATPLQNFANRVPEFPEHQILHTDFFNIKKQFDLIVEQTFFCALNPDLRMSYAEKIHELLKPNGRLVGLLFDFKLSENGPPFGGSHQEYLNYFDNKFNIHKLERCYNSHPKRLEKELFINFEKQEQT